jgi:hypothetical protein
VIILLITLGVVFLTTFLAAPTMGAGWFWDTGNGLGFAAFGGLLYIGITSCQRPDVRAHQILGYTVLCVAAAHALWFLLGDAAAIEYVKIGAPDYMWLGIAGLVLLFLLVNIAQMPDRLRVHKNYSAFRYWHRVLAVATIACCTYHIVVSDFCLATAYQAVLFIILAAIASFGRAWWVKLGQLTIATPSAFLLVTVLLSGLFTVIRNFHAGRGSADCFWVSVPGRAAKDCNLLQQSRSDFTHVL